MSIFRKTLRKSNGIKDPPDCCKQKHVCIFQSNSVFDEFMFEIFNNRRYRNIHSFISSKRSATDLSYNKQRNRKNASWFLRGFGVQKKSRMIDDSQSVRSTRRRRTLPAVRVWRDNKNYSWSWSWKQQVQLDCGLHSLAHDTQTVYCACRKNCKKLDGFFNALPTRRLADGNGGFGSYGRGEIKLVPKTCVEDGSNVFGKFQATSMNLKFEFSWNCSLMAS